MNLAVTGLGLRRPGTRSAWLIRDLDASFEPGRVSVVIGPNGSGKTTLLRALAGLHPPDAGSITLGDRPLDQTRRRERGTQLAYLPQQTPLYHDLVVSDLVMLGRSPHLSRFAPPSSLDRSRVDQALARVGLRSLARRPITTLSGGERQRVMLARMLASEAPVLLLDEPTTALDIGHALAFLGLCRTLASAGHTVVLAMHDLELARRHGDDLVCLTDRDDGRVHRGSVGETLTPELIHDVFRVDARLGPDGLVLTAPTSAES